MRSSNRSVFNILLMFVLANAITIDVSVAGDVSTLSGEAVDVEQSLINRAEKTYDKYKRLKCKKSKSPLFQAKPSDVLKVEILADFKYINTETYSEEGGDSGILLYRDDAGKAQYIPIFIKDRGNSRRDYCEWVPLRILFESQDVQNELSGLLGAMPDNEKKMWKLYELLKAKRKVDRFVDGVSQKNNIFSKLGDDIKVVTHCGKSEWARVGGDTKELQERRILLEYYIYQILDQLRTTSLKTRLAEITYRDPSGKEMLTRKAFFREPVGKMAKRCGLSHKKDPDVEYQEFDAVSLFQLELYNKFIYSNDYEIGERNTITLYAKDGRRYLAPYDFDLVGIIVPDYRPNGKSVEQFRVEDFQPWIQSLEGNEMAIVQIAIMLHKKAKMRDVILNAVLMKKDKQHLLNWFDSYMRVLEAFMEKSRRTNPDLVKGLELREIQKETE